MEIRSSFSSFIQQNTGVAKPQIVEVAEPANSDAEKFIPSLAENMAGYYGAVNSSLPENQLNALKKPMAEFLDKHPSSIDVLADISDKACPETLATGFKAGPQEGIFSLDVSEVNLFGSSNGSLCGAQAGTLFVDTTPGQDGMQYYYHAK